MKTALLPNRGKGPFFSGVFRILLKVGIGRVALTKLLIVLKIIGKTAASRPEHLIRLVQLCFLSL